MPKDSFNLPQGLPQKVNSAESFLVVLPQNLTIDSVAAALSLFLSLKKKSKRVKIGTPNEITVEFNRLFGVDKITSKIGSKNLIISFPENSVEKVSSQIEGDKLNLVIRPKTGSQLPDPKNLKYSFSGVDADVIFILGAQRIKDLGELYEQDKKVFDEKETINIDINPSNTKFAKNNLVFPEQVALSQIVAVLIKRFNLSVDQDIATNLIAGIESATNNFQTITTADVFETIAWCLRQGGKQKHLKSDGFQQSKPPFSQAQTSASPFQKPEVGQQQVPPIFATPQATPQAQNSFQMPPPPFVQQAQNTQSTIQSNEKSEEKNSAPTPDWFKPKIFSGSGMRKG